MDPTDLLDREWPDLTITSFHEPFEPIDDPQHVRAAENTADRDRADHTINAGSRPTTDENADHRSLLRHRLLPRPFPIGPPPSSSFATWLYTGSCREASGAARITPAVLPSRHGREDGCS